MSCSTFWSRDEIAARKINENWGCHWVKSTPKLTNRIGVFKLFK